MSKIKFSFEQFANFFFVIKGYCNKIKSVFIVVHYFIQHRYFFNTGCAIRKPLINVGLPFKEFKVIDFPSIVISF
jgi:hypothetical protein